MGKVDENKRQKLERLLNTTFTLFTTRGMAKTSISDIATAAGIAKGTFYLYFKDKDDIRDALIARMAQNVFCRAFEGQEQSQKPLEDKIIYIIDSLMNQLQENPLMLRFISKNLSWSTLRSALMRAEEKGELDYLNNFYRLAVNDSDEWDHPEIMLFTITELVGSTCHSIVLEHDPVDLSSYKPYLYRTIRSIVASHRKASGTETV
jgi:AcrR family transcriptional regulator